MTLAAVTLLVTTTVHAAQNTEHGIEITPMVGYRSGGSFEDPATQETLDLDEGPSSGLVINIDHDANTQWEFVYSHQETELQLGPTFSGNRQFDLNVDYLAAGGAYVWRDARVQPYISATVGIAYLDPQDSTYDAETRFLLQLAGGYKYFVSPNLGLRIEARGYATMMDTDAEVFCGNGACVARIQSSGFGQVEINAGMNLRF
ncbi:MAG: outer membrane beta-barrel protein [Gammaproteobacteria bacterium]|nr:outer membrane beta-barrel protein [Gammaproteobacteria bacterium]